MKPVITLLILIIFSGNIRAQNYLISFAGTGASSTVDSVKVENLSQCTSLTMAGTDILNLTSSVGINTPGELSERFITVYPNPSAGNSIISFKTSSSDKITIELTDISGITVLRQQLSVNEGHSSFRLSNIKAGTYLLTVESPRFRYTAKLLSLALTASVPQLTDAAQAGFVDNLPGNNLGGRTVKAGGYNPVIGMQFNAGDTLKLTGKSGNYHTVTMLFPTQSQTVIFDFVKCTDADSNHYAVVQIGSQLWMQENLKTTRFRDGTPIPNVTDSAASGSLTSAAYCNFHNDPAEGDYYGRLYNFYAVSDARNIAPVGWHVASNPEWNILEKYLDPTVDTSATAWMGRGTIIGRILKEGCDTRWQYYDTTYGWNSAGFSALCSNFRNNTGAWSMAPDNNHDNAFWTSTAYSGTTAWGLSLRWCYGDIYVIPLINMRSGSSVRCIKDE